MQSLLSEVDAAVWERRQLYRNTLTTDFAQAFQNDQNNISDAVNEIGPLVSQDLPSHSGKSHDFLMRLEELNQQMCFHLPLTVFHMSTKTT